jgi:molybdopterin-guanine dinucleotide biosynthesis protein A
MASPTIAGIFVGGAATRMGGRAKGFMQAPDGRSIIERLCAMLRAIGVADVILVGEHPAYTGLGLEALEDEPRGIGPLGGLVALLRRAGAARALALACDMPFVSRDLLERVVAANDAPIVAPRLGDRWEPLCARYEAARVLPVAQRRVATGDHSLQRLLDEASAAELPLLPSDAEELRDWDAPGDIHRSRLVP